MITLNVIGNKKETYYYYFTLNYVLVIKSIYCSAFC